MHAVILAGGKGTRLRPYTTILPKPLMPIGDMPILEVVLRQLEASGFKKITMAVGHLEGLLKAFFGNGNRFGLEIRYSRENEPLGTVGPLTLIEDLPENFLMMNGDILTTLNYNDFMKFHLDNKAIATIATHIRNVKIDLGVVETDENRRLTGYVEKPTMEYTVSMGIYAFRFDVLRYITGVKYIDFPDLVKMLIKNGEKVISYPYDGYWLDIGRPDDFATAVKEFEQRKEEFLPGSSL